MTVVARPSEEAPAAVAGDVGAIGCVQADARLERTRAFVKIQDGCSFSCAFCVIPLVRGATRSRAAGAVLAEIERRVAQGHREIVLTGVNLGCFRDREAGYALPRLVREAGAIPGVERLRLSSIEVNHLGRRSRRGAARDADRVAPSPRPAPVGRRRRAPRDATTLLGGAVPREARAARATSTSPPTSSSASRARTRRRSRARSTWFAQAGITRVHAFPYSPRPGTSTAAADTVPSR